MDRIIKRSFWTISKGKVIGRILAVDNIGLIFTHNQFRYRLSGNITDPGQEWHCSVENHTNKNDIMMHLANNIGNRAVIEYEQHLLGSPLIGWIQLPVYLKSINFNDPLNH